MHTTINKDNLENIMQRNTKTNATTKRSAFGDISNQGNRPNPNKQVMKKENLKVTSTTTTTTNQTQIKNTFVAPLPITTNNVLQQTQPSLLQTKLNTNVISKSTVNQLLELRTNDKIDEVNEEEIDQDVLDMSISIEEMSNMSLENIDEVDTEDPTCCTEYVNDIYEFLRMKELTESLDEEFFDTTQKDINPKMRAILIDWLVDVHLKFKLLNDTLFMAVSLIDRFLAKECGSRKKLQLVGVTAMLIASKFEEIYAPEVGDFVYICDKAYSREEILQYEILMLNTLSFEISHPTPLHFLRRFSKAAKSDSKAHTLSKYLIELSLMDIELQKRPFCPSMIAAASIYITRKMINPKLYWNSNLRHYTQYKESQIMPCVLALNETLKKTQQKGSSLNAIFRKYSTRYFGVANIPHIDI